MIQRGSRLPDWRPPLWPLSDRAHPSLLSYLYLVSVGFTPVLSDLTRRWPPFAVSVSVSGRSSVSGCPPIWPAFRVRGVRRSSKEGPPPEYGGLATSSKDYPPILLPGAGGGTPPLGRNMPRIPVWIPVRIRVQTPVRAPLFLTHSRPWRQLKRRTVAQKGMFGKVLFFLAPQTIAPQEE